MVSPIPPWQQEGPAPHPPPPPPHSVGRRWPSTADGTVCGDSALPGAGRAAPQPTPARRAVSANSAVHAEIRSRSAPGQVTAVLPPQRPRGRVSPQCL